MKTSIEVSDLDPILTELARANNAFNARFPGIKLDRLPVHTLYGGAHLFKKGTPAKLGSLAARNLNTYAPDFVAFAQALHLPGHEALSKDPSSTMSLTADIDAGEACDDYRIALEVYRRVCEKLQTEAIEDQRLDFEDGYGARADDEEDGHAAAAAVELAAGVREGVLPPFIGIRVKAFSEEVKHRAVRTLDIFLSTYAQENVPLPEPFFVTLPKVQNPAQVTALLSCIELLEDKCGFKPGAVKIEIMIETIQSIVNPQGEIGIPALIDAGRGRVTSAILGTFDYTASCNIASHYQDHRHPSADFARQMMQICLTGTDVSICDGITNIMPIAPHKGAHLSREQLEENVTVVHDAWRVHFENILHSLRLGFYQGWDLNPAQLPIRYAALYFFFLEGLEDAKSRLQTFIEQAAQASMVGNTFDDAASAQGLLNFFVNGINCGALKEDEALSTGITLDELHGRSFQKIVENRLKTVKGS